MKDQAKALTFYTEVLGFVKKQDMPMGGARWLTVVSPEGSHDIERLLEPMGHPAAQPDQAALARDGIPWTAFCVDDIQTEHERLKGLGVKCKSEPTTMGPATVAVFDATCGNLIQLYQV